MKKKTPTWVKVLIVGLTVLMYLFIISMLFWDFWDQDWKRNRNGSISIDGGSLTIQKEVEGYYDEQRKVFYILGTLTNNSSDDYDTIDIEYLVYDEEGNVLGNASAYLNKLKKGQSWKFKVIYDGMDAKDIKKFEIGDINVY